MDEGKICRKCGHRKSLALFYRRHQSEDGRGTACTSCIKKTHKRFREVQELRIALLRSQVHEPLPLIAPHYGGVSLCDQRIVPMLMSVFEQIGSGFR